MIDLDEHVQRLADSVEPPSRSPEADLARGRARLRHRNLAALGAALTTTAVVSASVVLVTSGTGQPGSAPGFAVMPSSAGPGDVSASTAPDAQGDAATSRLSAEEAVKSLPHTNDRAVTQTLDRYRDILREDLDPAGTRIQTGPITNQQAGDDSLGTKLDWNGGGKLQIAVGRSLEGVQFFCDDACTSRSVAGATKALVFTTPGMISVAVVQDDGDVVALTADTSFGNNGTSTRSLGLTVDDLLAAAADPRLDPPTVTGTSPGAR